MNAITASVGYPPMSIARDAPDHAHAEFVMYRLEQAGRTLIALPGRGCLPAGMGSAWPDVVHAAMEAYGYEKLLPTPAAPSAGDITRMDEAWTWIKHIPADRKRHRRIVLMRALVHPITERHRWSWRRMGKAFGWSHEAIRTWHAQGIDWIVSGLGREGVKADYNFR